MPYGPVEALAFPGLQPANLVAKAKEMLEGVADSAFDGVMVKRVVEVGDAALCIASLARDWDVGLIMIPTRGRGAFRAALLGSIAAKVLHDADCPVWTAAHVETLSGGKHIEWRRIICAVDLSAESTHLLQTVQDLSRTVGATVCIVHAVPGEEAFPNRFFNAEFESSETTGCPEHSGYSVRSRNGFRCLYRGWRGLARCRQFVRRHDADLVLARGLDRGISRLGSHTYAIIRDAGCPVLSI